MQTKQALVVILGIALVALLRLSPKAVDMGNPVILNQPPPEDTNCYPASTNVLCAPEPAPQFLSVTVTNQCAAGAMIVANATYTNVPGTVTTTITYSNPACPPLVTTNDVSSVILTNWWDAGCTNKSGLSASFSPPNCAGGTIYFYITYSNPPPCSNALTISTSIDYAIEADCSRHNPGSEVRIPDLLDCGTSDRWERSTNSLCGDTFKVACTGAVYVSGPGGPCGHCPYNPSTWDAWCLFCVCKAKIMETHFWVASTGTNQPTYGQRRTSDWECGGQCTNLCSTVLTWGVTNGVVYLTSWTDPVLCP